MIVVAMSDFAEEGALGVPSPAAMVAQQVDAQVRHAGQFHASLWWRRVPALTGERLGVIGHFRVGESGDAGLVAAGLDAACDTLRKAGCTLALGPMDGNTWRSYRFLTWRGDQPRFAFEPDQPDAWPLWWQKSNFVPYEQYWSALVTDLNAHDPRLEAVAARLERQGVVIRPVDLEHFAEELERIYAVSEIAFQGNVLYTPLPREEFLAMYAQVRPLMRQGLSFLAERAGAPVGFVFALPDLEQAKRGQPVDTVVIKTLAVLPGRDLAGLGKLLLEHCQHAARDAGWQRTIHALMHDGNTSRNLGDGAVEIRRYTLLARRLA